MRRYESALPKTWTMKFESSDKRQTNKPVVLEMRVWWTVRRMDGNVDDTSVAITRDTLVHTAVDRNPNKSFIAKWPVQWKIHWPVRCGHTGTVVIAETTDTKAAPKRSNTLSMQATTTSGTKWNEQVSADRERAKVTVPLGVNH